MTYKNSQPRSSLDHEDNVEGKLKFRDRKLIIKHRIIMSLGDAHMIINCIIFSMSCILVLLGPGAELFLMLKHEFLKACESYYSLL